MIIIAKRPQGMVSRKLHQHRHYLVATGKASYWMPYRSIEQVMARLQ